MANLTPEEQKKQERYRDARFTNQYDDIWQSVGKCVFCDLNEKYVFFEENGIAMTISLYAYIDGHFMIVPRRHVRSPRELTQIEWDTVRKFTYIAKKIIRDVHGVTGMQLVEKEGSDAQSTVTDHLHFHCIPFDAPDLCQWNYRQLKYTPLENTALYKRAAKKLIKHDERFEQKYRQPGGLPIITDLILLNERQEILFQERAEWAKLSPDTLSIPGGTVHNFDHSLESELAREVHEETGLSLAGAPIELFASRLETLGRARMSKPLQTTYHYDEQVMWNTYLWRGFDSTTPLAPGDDAKALVWIPAAQVAAHPRISPGLKRTIASLKL